MRAYPVRAGWLGHLICHPGEAPFEELARALAPEFKDDPEALSKLVGFSANAPTSFPAGGNATIASF